MLKLKVSIALRYW